MMLAIFYKDEIWDQYEISSESKRKNEPYPLYCLLYQECNQTWWMWYHSWNNITEDINSGGRELPPVAKAYLLLLGQ